jgi:serine/threonine protein phosphatase PrpC
MARQFITLLGKDYADPSTFGFMAIGDDAAIGIASIVTKKDKEHNLANNEDAAGILEDDKISIGMVADAHWGNVASQEAILRFPELFLRKQKELAGSDIRQVYLEAVLELCEKELPGIGRRSGVTHGTNRLQQIVYDESNSQFYSVIKVDRKYYFVGLGDCSCAIIDRHSICKVNSPNIAYGAVGSILSPRNYMRRSINEEGLARDVKLRFDDPLVRKGVDVQQLSVTSGDVIFICTDGYPIMSQTRGITLQEIFCHRTINQGLSQIMDQVMQNRKDYGDNIAICAIRVR